MNPVVIDFEYGMIFERTVVGTIFCGIASQPFVDTINDEIYSPVASMNLEGVIGVSVV